MGFLSIILQLCSAASTILPAIAAVKATLNPAAPAPDNAALINTAKAMQAVAPLVASAEAVSAASSTPMSGTDKLALLQAVVQDAHATAVANGVTTEPFDTYWNPINAAITAVVAQNKGSSITPGTPVSPA